MSWPNTIPRVENTIINNFDIFDAKSCIMIEQANSFDVKINNKTNATNPQKMKNCQLSFLKLVSQEF